MKQESSAGLESAAAELASLLRATATAFLAVGTSSEPPTIHVYWKLKQKTGYLREHLQIHGFPIRHHVSGAARPLSGGYPEQSKTRQSGSKRTP